MLGVMVPLGLRGVSIGVVYVRVRLRVMLGYVRSYFGACYGYLWVMLC